MMEEKTRERVTEKKRSRIGGLSATSAKKSSTIIARFVFTLAFARGGQREHNVETNTFLRL